MIDLPLSLRIASGWYRSPMSTLHESAAAVTDARQKYFASLDESDRQEAIRRMHVDGHSAYGIATATGLSVESVALILRGEP